jgi:hypothetical protein
MAMLTMTIDARKDKPCVRVDIIGNQCRINGETFTRQAFTHTNGGPKVKVEGLTSDQLAGIAAMWDRFAIVNR